MEKFPRAIRFPVGRQFRAHERIRAGRKRIRTEREKTDDGIVVENRPHPDGKLFPREPRIGERRTERERSVFDELGNGLYGIIGKPSNYFEYLRRSFGTDGNSESFLEIVRIVPEPRREQSPRFLGREALGKLSVFFGEEVGGRIGRVRSPLRKEIEILHGKRTLRVGFEFRKHRLQLVDSTRFRHEAESFLESLGVFPELVWVESRFAIGIGGSLRIPGKRGWETVRRGIEHESHKLGFEALFVLFSEIRKGVETGSKRLGEIFNLGLGFFGRKPFTFPRNHFQLFHRRIRAFVPEPFRHVTK